MNRLFLAVRPPTGVLDSLSDLPVRSAEGLRLVPRDQMHVTLRFLGDAEPEEVAAALDGFRPDEVMAHLGPRVTRLGRDALVVPVAGLDELAAEIGRRTTGLGDQPEGRPFRGHVTVARLRRRTPPPREWDPVDLSFEVVEVELISSTLTDQGAVHRTLSTWRAGPHTRS